jgi:hypothetical protein
MAYTSLLSHLLLVGSQTRHPIGHSVGVLPRESMAAVTCGTLPRLQLPAAVTSLTAAGDDAMQQPLLPPPPHPDHSKPNTKPTQRVAWRMAYTSTAAPLL